MAEFTTVERWVIKAGDYLTGVKSIKAATRQVAQTTKAAAASQADLEGRLNKTTSANKQLFSSFTDVKSGIDVAIGAVKSLTSAMDESLTNGLKFNQLMATAPFEIDKAAEATKGLVDNQALLLASNRQAALGLNLTEKEFSKLARQAVIAGQKLGNDAVSSINDVIVGLGRMSPMILDNLGITLKAKSAYADYAAELGKTADKLTDAEKKAGFTKAALKSLDEVVGKSKINVEGAGGAWVQFKIAIKNTGDLMDAAAAKGTRLAPIIRRLSEAMLGIGKFFGEGKTAQLRRKLAGTREELGRFDQGKGFVPVGQSSKSQRANLVRQEQRLAVQLQISRDEDQKAANRKAGAKAIADEKKRLASVAAAKARALASRKGKKRRDPASTSSGFDQVGLIDSKESLREEREGNRAAADQAAANKKQSLAFAFAEDNAAAAADRKNKRLREGVDVARDANMAMTELANGGLNSLAGGLLNAADAAIQAGGGFGKAMLQMTKGVLLGISKQAISLAIFNTAKGFAALATTMGVPNPASIAAFTAAKTFAVVAAVSGAAGLGISAATAGGGGGGPGRGRGGGGSGFAPSRDGIGSQKRQKIETTIEVFMGDRDNPGVARFDKRRLEAKLKR